MYITDLCMDYRYGIINKNKIVIKKFLNLFELYI